MSTLPIIVFALLALAVRARVERRQQRAWDERDAIRAAAEMRALKTVMCSDAEALAARETRHYINRLDAAIARPGESEAA